ncbi:hypothetical protein B0H16DRAFT_1488104 [Mycena metata]|uniref:Uncharacterized protein n=1 Tax=Mycena metata TaxID=1033252 RepID=A0AAD7KIB8_9AGAR|nr:hypothetical protein B0H16DRAFT_1488104 [Mycena metata]
MLHPVAFERTVLFKPRPVVGSSNREWVPRSTRYRPYHPEFEAVPEDVTDEWHFTSSPTLEAYLFEFYTKIKNLFDKLPDLATNYYSLCDMARRFENSAKEETSLAFAERLAVITDEHFRDLSDDAAADVSFSTQPTQTRPGYRLLDADFLSMNSELIVLKVWVSMLSEVND